MKKYTDSLAVLILTLALITISVTATFANGLTFKVDLGEFSEEINEDLLKGYDHVRYEVAGIYSYQIGEFANYYKALDVSNEFYEKGFSEAEVVAFFNRASIPMEDAFTLMGDRNMEEAIEAGAYNEIDIEKFNAGLDETVVSDVVFTVQIGVFSKQKTDADFGLDEVIVEREAGELFNYSCGEFATREAAENALIEIADSGFADAFVTAYRNDERIDPDSLEE